MNFATNYFKRFNSSPKIFPDNPRSNTGIIVVIPCYNDPFIFKTLESLDSAIVPKCKVEVIVIVNSSETTPLDIVEVNRNVYSELCSKENSNCFNSFKLYSHIIENVPKKIAGVGNARKLGMDEAVRRFDSIEARNGIIVSLDADTLVSQDYFVSIEKSMNSNLKAVGATFQFQHDFSSELYSEDEIYACRLYEIYLRYFRLALKGIGFPNSFHTIGSCFGVRAEAYTKVGGMSRRQGGEDFYFLQKLAQVGKIFELNEVLVYPAPRMSDRVPFGTGPAVAGIISTGEYKVYNYKLFRILEEFFKCLPQLYTLSDSKYLFIIPYAVMDFVDKEKLNQVIVECKSNTKDINGFVKRMMTNFDAFWIIKFLNSFNDNSSFPELDVVEAANLLLKENVGTYAKSTELVNVYNQIFELDLQ